MTNSTQHHIEILQERFGLRVAARLSAGLDLPFDVSERLRAARVRAVARRKLVLIHQPSVLHNGGGSAVLGQGGDGLNLWSRIASFLPLLVLIVGLMVITVVQNESGAKEVAEVDAALLTDDLPPAAYTDPGFLQFLKAGAAQRP